MSTQHAQQELFFTLSAQQERHEQSATTLSPQEAAVVRAALSYTLARRSAGCPYAPEWEDATVVGCVGPLLGRLKC